MSALARRALAGIVGVIGLTGLMLATACSSGRTTGGPAALPRPSASPAHGTSASGDPGRVTIHLVAFEPQTLEIAQGRHGHGVKAAIEHHATTLKAVVDDQKAGDAAKAATDLRTAVAHMSDTAGVIAGATVKKFPDKLSTT